MSFFYCDNKQYPYLQLSVFCSLMYLPESDKGGGTCFFPCLSVCLSLTIRYDSVYLTCSKKLTSSQLSVPHGINKITKARLLKKRVHGFG